eukprot:1524782-Rhodomonas_salina.2
MLRRSPGGTEGVKSKGGCETRGGGSQLKLKELSADQKPDQLERTRGTTSSSAASAHPPSRR